MITHDLEKVQQVLSVVGKHLCAQVDAGIAVYMGQVVAAAEYTQELC